MKGAGKMFIYLFIVFTSLILTPNIVRSAQLDVDNSVSCGGTGEPYCSIEDALLNASDGDVINVSAGVYTPTSQVVIDKEVSIYCAQKDVDTSGRIPASASETLFDFSGRYGGFVIKSSNVEINGCSIKGDDSTNYGIYIAAEGNSVSNISIKYNFIFGMKEENTANDSVYAYGILADAKTNIPSYGSITGLKITDNEIFDIGGKPLPGGNLPDGTIPAVSGGLGISLHEIVGINPGDGAHIENNYFHNIYDGLDQSTPQYGSGISVAENGYLPGTMPPVPLPSSGVLIQNNKYQDITGAVAVYAGSSEVSESNVDLGNTSVYVLNIGTLASVDTSDLAPYSQSNDVAGFVSTEGYFAKIQDAINSSNPSAVVSVGDGIYNENLNIDRPLTLTAASNPILEGDGTGIGIKIASSNVAVRKFTIRNFATGIEVQPGIWSKVRINKNNIIGNSDFGINNLGSKTVNARRNYWGSCDGPSGAGPGSGDAVSNKVVFSPWTGCNLIEGIKYEDVDGDGKYDQNIDNPLSGWTIDLLDSSMGILATTTTGSDGRFEFQIFQKGTFYVSEEMQQGWKPSTPTTSQAIVFSSKQGGTAYVEFGNYRPVSISGLKYHDRDGDGERDIDINNPQNSEEGLSGWTIIAEKGNMQYATTTDENGNFVFFDLPPGNYDVYEVQQSGWMQTSTTTVYSIFIPSGGSVSGVEFGNFKLGRIRGVKYHDLNGNGIKDAGEPTLSNWKIYIEDNQGNKTYIYTDSNGEYEFQDLFKGTYRIYEKKKSKWYQSQPGQLNNFEYIISITESGEEIAGIDFGNYKLASIQGRKYEDENENGKRNRGEKYLSGWQIELVNLRTGEIKTAVTNSKGKYKFKNLVPGPYIVREVLKQGWIPINPKSSFYKIDVHSGQKLKGISFGNIKVDDKIDNEIDDILDNITPPTLPNINLPPGIPLPPLPDLQDIFDRIRNR